MNPDPRIEVLLEVSQGQLLHSALFLLRGLPDMHSTFCNSTFCNSTFCLFYLLIVLPFVVLPYDRSTFCHSTFCNSTFCTGAIQKPHVLSSLQIFQA